MLSTDTGFPPEMVGSREAKEFFDENGYMIVRGCLSPLEVSECAVTIRELHERAARGEPGSFGFETLARDQLTADGLPILRKIEQTGELSPVFHRLAEHPTLIRAWQNAIGDDNLLLFRSTLMLKPAEHGSAHALHQGACKLLLLRGFIESLEYVLSRRLRLLAAAARRRGRRRLHRAAGRGREQRLLSHHPQESHLGAEALGGHHSSAGRGYHDPAGRRRGRR